MTQLKMKCLELLQNANFGENKCIKEAVVKIFVEVVKRCWPQEWPSLFTDLSSIHVRGDGQLELVLIVLMNSTNKHPDAASEAVRRNPRGDNLTLTLTPLSPIPPVKYKQTPCDASPQTSNPHATGATRFRDRRA